MMLREAYAQSYSKSERLVENWKDYISVVNSVNDKPLTHDQQLVLAQCLENTNDTIKMLEATDAHCRIVA